MSTTEAGEIEKCPTTTIVARLAVIIRFTTTTDLMKGTELAVEGLPTVSTDKMPIHQTDMAVGGEKTR